MYIYKVLLLVESIESEESMGFCRCSIAVRILACSCLREYRHISHETTETPTKAATAKLQADMTFRLDMYRMDPKAAPLPIPYKKDCLAHGIWGAF